MANYCKAVLSLLLSTNPTCLSFTFSQAILYDLTPGGFLSRKDTRDIRGSKTENNLADHFGSWGCSLVIYCLGLQSSEDLTGLEDPFTRFFYMTMGWEASVCPHMDLSTEVLMTWQLVFPGAKVIWSKRLGDGGEKWGGVGEKERTTKKELVYFMCNWLFNFISDLQSLLPYSIGHTD